MKEHPILFSAPMVRAILEGRKNQTRRPIKWKRTKYQSIEERDDGTLWPWRETEDAQDYWYPCPYGQPGDHLWVREAWQGPLLESDEQVDEFRQSPDIYKKPGFCAYRATDTLDAIDENGKELGWRPSIHMPRWASRILLEITGVRVERLQDISEDDAKAEGADCLVTENCTAENRALLAMPLMDDATPYRNGYALLWESINGDGSWAANPWVWVVKFKRVEA